MTVLVQTVVGIPIRVIKFDPAYFLVKANSVTVYSILVLYVDTYSTKVYKICTAFFIVRLFFSLGQFGSSNRIFQQLCEFELKIKSMSFRGLSGASC